ncbi:MAG TPA: sialidase family protein, partial [Opitutus sp.]|nr:sialidase family protein [Opitutus sp.]
MSKVKCSGTAKRPFPTLTTVAVAGAKLPVKHLFIPCLFITASGQHLLLCRWDERGSEEGDASNEQALYSSDDQGATWRMANDGRPLITLAHGTSFALPSAITGAWLFEDVTGGIWAYYTINQPFTWGADLPHRSTGGEEIRRVRLEFDGRTWRVVAGSEMVWACRQRLPDGQGGWCDDVWLISWNGLLRTSCGILLMPVGGRSTVSEPRGAFWKLNRVWMLTSDDDGRTWTQAHFVAGSDSRCFAEPTIVETGTAGEIVCLLRVQYGTGNQLHRAVSHDFGRTWSNPVPTGLPNANQHGAKPYLLRTRDGNYVLAQTNEHSVVERTNLALFKTDEAGLLSDRWPDIKTLHVRHRSGWWPGACYAWLAENPRDGSLAVAFPGFDNEQNYLFFTHVSADIFEYSDDVEPNGVIDEKGDHLPRRFQDATGRTGFRFTNVRGRLTATRFDRRICETPARVSFEVRIVQLNR